MPVHVRTVPSEITNVLKPVHSGTCPTELLAYAYGYDGSPTFAHSGLHYAVNDS